MQFGNQMWNMKNLNKDWKQQWVDGFGWDEDEDEDDADDDDDDDEDE